jgi:hypothetical protein
MASEDHALGLSGRRRVLGYLAISAQFIDNLNLGEVDKDRGESWRMGRALAMSQHNQ